MWEENRKILDIVNEKTFQPGLRIEKEKPRLVDRGEICLRRETWLKRYLVKERLGQNKVLCSSLGVELQMFNYHAGSLAFSALRRQISGYLLTSGSKTVLTRILPCHFFFVASLGALFSASCRLPLFPLCGELDRGLGNGLSGVQGC